MSEEEAARAAGCLVEDREIRFDAPLQRLEMITGEREIDSINAVEDTKGNNGEKGCLAVTNIRLVWNAHRNPRTNLSIGFNCIISCNIRMTNSRLKGNSQALYVLARFRQNRYEFIFTSLVNASPRLFTTVQAVYRSYESSRLYRDVKLRGAILKEKQLILLPHEQIIRKVPGIWNLSSSQGNLGTFFVTNARVVWHANMAENFNISIPYLQMQNITVRNSKFGVALVIETSALSGGYILGFRVDPEDALDPLVKELQSLHRVFTKTPMYGVEATIEEAPKDIKEVAVKRYFEDVQIVDEMAGESTDTSLSYFMDPQKNVDREPALVPEIGLAFEKLPQGYTIKHLWSMAV
eukprot:GILK01004474.1.p1 GENE.GILK01004474.1~~GILK01004474.1.p1  ORF type:complete len:366 (-),score=75.70 GILK01004474.1:200-1252(-)